MEGNRINDDKSKATKLLSNSEMVASSLFSGAVAGAMAKTTIAPLDRTKISFQVSSETYSTRKAWKFLLETFKKEGFFNLWRGNSATMARIIPYAALQFTSHEQWKRLLSVDSVDNSEESRAKRFLAGSLAGVTSQTLTYPLDLARARMAITKKHQYQNLKQVFVEVWKYEGIWAFYRGWIPTMLGIIPYAGTSFFTYGTLKRVYKEKTGHKSGTSANLMFGAISGIVGQSTSYPLDIVRRRMQTSFVTGYQAATILATMQKIYREEGLKNGFFKGLSMNWIKGPIAVGISFATYDYVRESFNAVLLKLK